MAISETEKQLIYLQIEKAHANMTSAVAVFNKATMMYFILMILALFGMTNNYITKSMLNTLIIMGMMVLIIGAIPYFRSVVQEEKTINNLIEEVKRKK